MIHSDFLVIENFIARNLYKHLTLFSDYIMHCKIHSDVLLTSLALVTLFASVTPIFISIYTQ